MCSDICKSFLYFFVKFLIEPFLLIKGKIQNCYEMKQKTELVLLVFLFNYFIKRSASAINLTRYADVIIILDF